MSRNPVAHDRSELADLHRQAAILPGRDAHCIFVEAHLSAAIARIKTAIEPRLREEINLRSDLRVEKQGQTRIEKCVNAAVDETGRWLFEVIDFQIERAAEARAEIIVKCGNAQRRVQAVEGVINVERARCAGEHAQAESVQLHATPLTPSTAEKRTSNSVQSFSDRTNRKSPPCNRASSRARFKPIPWPEAAEGVEL